MLSSTTVSSSSTSPARGGYPDLRLIEAFTTATHRASQDSYLHELVRTTCAQPASRSGGHTAAQGSRAAAARFSPAMEQANHQLERHSHLGPQVHPQPRERDPLGPNFGREWLPYPA